MNRLLHSARARWISVLCLVLAVAAVTGYLVLGERDGGPEAAAVQDRPTATPSVRVSTPAATPTATPAETPTAEETTPEPEQQEEPPAEEPAPPPPAVVVPQEPGMPPPAEDAGLAAVEQPVAPPAPIDQPSEQKGVEVSVTQLEAVTGQAEGIGQIGGPALRFTITVRNNTDAALDLSQAVVTVESGDQREPGSELMGPGATAFPQSVPPGQAASATYVFLVPPEQRAKVLILFNYAANAPILAFEGPAPA